jgi:hypothetical protein
VVDIIAQNFKHLPKTAKIGVKSGLCNNINNLMDCTFAPQSRKIISVYDYIANHYISSPGANMRPGPNLQPVDTIMKNRGRLL